MTCMIVLTEQEKATTPISVDDEGDVYLHFNEDTGQGMTAVLNQAQFLRFVREAEIMRGSL